MYIHILDFLFQKIDTKKNIMASNKYFTEKNENPDFIIKKEK